MGYVGTHCFCRAAGLLLGDPSISRTVSTKWRSRDVYSANSAPAGEPGFIRPTAASTT